jgi:hypothetical protein
MNNAVTHYYRLCVNLWARFMVLQTGLGDCMPNPVTPELNPSAQRCLTKFFTGDFAF